LVLAFRIAIPTSLSNLSLEPHPIQCDILKAVSTIGRYVGDLNDPIAYKIEALLGSFNMQLHLDEARRMKATHITNFFERVTTVHLPYFMLHNFFFKFHFFEHYLA